MRISVLALSLLLASGASSAAFAQDSASELAALRQQIEALQARLSELEAREASRTTTAQASETASMPKVETRGGLKVTSADGNAEFSLGGRIHFDAYAFDRDLASVTGGTEFRRARVTLAGKAHGWEYKLEQDFAGGSNLDGLRDAYIARTLGPGKLTIGQFKPYRSMEELTSSNEILMMERPFTSASGLYSGRQFQQGLGYLVGGGHYTLGASLFTLRAAPTARNEGIGFAARGTWAPVNDEDRTVHLGLSFSDENSNQGTPTLSAVANYAGRRGPSQTIASVTSGSSDRVRSLGLEAAASIGAGFVQAEYMRADFGQPLGGSQTVDAWYVQGSWLLTGGHKPYKTGTGVFGSAKVPAGGAWELTARHDRIKNQDISGREASSTLFGVNYYVNPQLRFMLNYTRGDNEVTGDNTNQYALRTQLSF